MAKKNLNKHKISVESWLLQSCMVYLKSFLPSFLVVDVEVGPDGLFNFLKNVQILVNQVKCSNFEFWVSHSCFLS